MKSLIFLIFLIAISLSGNAQKKIGVPIEFKNQQLEEVLNSLEKVYNVKFSYKSELVSAKTFSLSKASRTLDEVLFEITLQHNIKFNQLDDRYIFLVKNQTKVLEEVVVESYIARGIAKKKDASVEIQPKAIGLLPGLTEADILESIQQLPGVVSINETATALAVRGGNSDQNRMIWDGINIYHSGHLFGMVSVFNPNVAQQIIFYNKGTNAKFGERISSVIDIATSNKIEDSFQAELGLNSINADVFVTTPVIKNKLSVQGSFRRSYEDVFETKGFKSIEEKVFQGTRIEDEFFSFKDYNLKVNFKPNYKNSFYASLIYIDNDLENDYLDPHTNISYEDKLDSENNGYSLQWNRLWGKLITQQTLINVSNYSLNYDFITKQNDQFVSDFSKKNLIFDTGASTEFILDFNSGNILSVGYQFNHKDVSYIFEETTDLQYVLDSDQSIINTNAMYGNFSYRNTKLFDADFGLRLAHYSNLNSLKFEPRIILNRNITPSLKIQLTGEIKNQIISQIEETILSDLSLESKLWRLADGDKFPIINGKQVSAGIIYTKNTWDFDFDFYLKKTDGLSSLSQGFLNPVDVGFHLGEQEIKGFDFYLKKRINKFKTWITYSYIDAQNKYEDINDDEYFRSNTDIKHAVSTSFSYSINQLDVVLGWNWRSGKPITEAFTDSNGNVISFGEINAETLPSYSRLDFSSTYSFKLSSKNKLRGKFGISIRNILNIKNHLNTEFTGSHSVNEPIKIIEKYSLGITPNFLLRVYW